METYVDSANRKFSDETKTLVWINDRYANEDDSVQKIRFDYWQIIQSLTEKRAEAWRSEAGRNYSLAITHAEDSCIRAVKAFYS